MSKKIGHKLIALLLISSLVLLGNIAYQIPTSKAEAVVEQSATTESNTAEKNMTEATDQTIQEQEPTIPEADSTADNADTSEIADQTAQEQQQDSQDSDNQTITDSDSETSSTSDATITTNADTIETTDTTDTEVPQQTQLDETISSEEILQEQVATADVLQVNLEEILEMYRDNPNFRTEAPEQYELYSKSQESEFKSQNSLQTDGMSVTSTGNDLQTEGSSLQNFINSIPSRRSIYNTDVPQLADRYNQEEYISEQTGSLTLKHTDLVLPGKDGLDLEISRFYNSSQSEIGNKKVIVKMSYAINETSNLLTGCQLYIRYQGYSSDTLWQMYSPITLNKFYNFEAAYLKGEELKNSDPDIEYYYVLCPEDLSTCISPGEYYIQTELYSYTDSDNYLRYRYDLGDGWSFGLPSVQKRIEDLGIFTTEDLTFHNGKGSAYEVDITDDSDDSNLVDYQGKDVVFDLTSTLGKSYTNSDTGESAYYVYIEQGNKQYYFTSDGRLIGIKDRLGNEIKFGYITRTVKILGSARPWETSSGDTHSYKYISTITDTVGRTLNFNYVDNLDSNGQFSSGQIDVTVHDPDDNIHTLTLHYIKDTFSSAYTQYIWDFSTDYLQYVITSQDPGVRLEPRLSSYIDSDNKTTNYEYYGTDYYPDYSNTQSIRFGYHWFNNVSYDTLCLLKKITYPQSCTYYEYEKKTRCWASLGELYYDYIINKRYDTELRNINGSTVENGNLKEATYSYVWDHTTARVKQVDYSSTSVINGITTTYTYNEDSQLKSIVTTDGSKTKETTISAYHSTYKYKPTNSMTTESDSSGSVDVFNIITYNDWGGVENSADNLSPYYITEYSYNDSNNKFLLTGRQWYKDASTLLNEEYVYDGQGQLIRYINPNDEETNYTYTRTGNSKTTQITNALEGGKTAKTIETCGTATKGAFPTQIDQYYTDSSGNYTYTRTTKTHDMLLGLVKTVTDDSANQTQYEYDNLGRITYTKLPDVNNCTVEQFTTYEVGVTAPEFDATNQGLITTLVESYTLYTDKTSGQEYTYDHSKRYYNCYGQLVLDLIYDQDASTWLKQAEYHYDDYGNPIYQIDALGNVITCVYDAWGNVTQSVDPHGNTYYEELTYPLNTWAKTNYMIANGSSTQEFKVKTVYDQWGRVTSRTAQPSGLTESYQYDVVGNMVRYTDPKNNIYQYDYDKLNRLVSVTDPDNKVTQYTHTILGGLKTIKFTDGTNNWITTKGYDELGHLLTSTDPDGLQDAYTYNNLGQISQSKDPNNNQFSYTYDSQNRPTLKSVGSLNIGHQYGQHPYGPDLITGSIGTTIGYTYNGLGEVEQTNTTSDSYSQQVNYQYDDLGRITSIQDPTGITTGYIYDKDWLQSVQINGGGNVDYDYYPNGKTKSITYPALPNGSIIKSTYEYDGLGHLTKVSNLKDTSILSKYEYTYDNNSNISSITKQIGTGSAEVTSYGYDSLNRLKSITRPDSTVVNLTYDVRGNRFTEEPDNPPLGATTGGTTFNALNELTQYTNNGQTVSYQYSPNGLRIKKTVDSVTIRYVYDSSGRVIMESDGNNQPIASYIWGPDQVLAVKYNNQNYYYLFNGHGDVVQIIDQAGNIVNSYDYDEWGNITSQQEQISNPFKYVGEIYDSETGLYYLRARYYDPVIGRFISRDSLEGDIANPLSLNRYTYCENNPLRYIDPSGHAYEWIRGLSDELGGNVTWNAERKTASVTWSGVTIIFKGSIRNGKMYVDRDYFMNAFRKEYGKTDLRAPDFATTQVYFGIKDTKINKTLAIEEDRYGNWYASVGSGTGTSANKTGLSISGSVSWIDTDTIKDKNYLYPNGQPQENCLKTFMTDNSVNAMGAFGVGYGKTITSIGRSNDFWVSSPTGGTSASYGFYIGNHRKWLGSVLGY